MRVQDLYHSMAFVEVAKSLAPSNVKGHGKIPYQKTPLKSMAHGVHPHHYSIMYTLAQCAVPTQRERSIVTCFSSMCQSLSISKATAIQIQPTYNKINVLSKHTLK